jgi:hypothetical protein
MTFSRRFNWGSRYCEMWCIFIHLTTWEWRQYVPSKRREPLTEWRSITSHKTRTPKTACITKPTWVLSLGSSRKVHSHLHHAPCPTDWSWWPTIQAPWSPAVKSQILSVRTYEISGVWEKGSNTRCIIPSQIRMLESVSIKILTNWCKTRAQCTDVTGYGTNAEVSVL